MRSFRFIEPDHGKDSLTDHEIIELKMDFDIDVAGLYALMPITKAEFDLLKYLDRTRMEWRPDNEKIPADGIKANPIIKIGTVRICYECNQIVCRDPYNPSYNICGCKDMGQVSLGRERDRWRPAHIEIRMK